MALKENSKVVFNYVVDHEAQDITAKDIAAAIHREPRSVNGTLTSLQRKGLIARIPIKLIKLTDAGKEFDPDAPDEKDA